MSRAGVCRAERVCCFTRQAEATARDQEVLFPTKGVDMYAVIKTGGKQYKVAAGEKIKVVIAITADVGQEIVIDQVLAVGNGAELKVGAPLVDGAWRTATVVSHGRRDKVHLQDASLQALPEAPGHRQNYTELQISAVVA
ncbi:MAG: 50S ribosomal protein L21 [Sphaerotilus natans]